MKKLNYNLPRCTECGGTVRLTAIPGRTRQYSKKNILSIPDDFETPICSSCGEEFMIPEISEPLDKILKRKLLLKSILCRAIEIIGLLYICIVGYCISIIIISIQKTMATIVCILVLWMISFLISVMVSAQTQFIKKY